MKSMTELKTLAASLRVAMEAGCCEQFSLLERPVVLAELFELKRRDKAALRNLELESTMANYVGLAVQGVLAGYVALYDKLVAEGHDASNSFEFGNDAYCYFIPHREVEAEEVPAGAKGLLGLIGGEKLPPHVVKAFVVETQSTNWVVVLEERFGRHTLHIRQFWDDPALLDSPDYHGTFDQYTGSNLSIKDVVRLAAEAADRFSDDMPGVNYPKRPCLNTFLRGSLVPGHKDAGIGLRYADGRDKGYVLSYEQPYGDCPAVKDVHWFGFHRISHAMERIGFAVSMLVPELAPDGGADLLDD
ncbi:hypothetical protein WDL1P1_00285 (plasmid) [Variovorax sp. WDL1]|nr:hypothetical protein APY03_0925 [Variovorax sp. WDL1]PNG50242.1 hypothetical protein CHC06_05865 [Variovorax sp. B2]PNG51115.1 hypothetical protein CHC07_05771 [Variovorax sp. B4]VTV17310.1 hypothetical protein WDL1P1_00285 [Variovorax sp. WDL1]